MGMKVANVQMFVRGRESARTRAHCQIANMQMYTNTTIDSEKTSYGTKEKRGSETIQREKNLTTTIDWCKTLNFIGQPYDREHHSK